MSEVLPIWVYQGNPSPPIVHKWRCLNDWCHSQPFWVDITHPLCPHCGGEVEPICPNCKSETVIEGYDFCAACLYINE
jgi:predicted amidophosphoribosyltransferase